MAETFKSNICQYNAAFAFTSLGVKIDDQSVTNAQGPYCFRINGELHHLSGALLPGDGEQPVYAQIYIHDPLLQLQMCRSNNLNLNPVIMTELQAMIHETHPYVQLYQKAYEVMANQPLEEQENVYVKLHSDRTGSGPDPR